MPVIAIDTFFTVHQLLYIYNHFCNYYNRFCRYDICHYDIYNCTYKTTPITLSDTGYSISDALLAGRVNLLKNPLHASAISAIIAQTEEHLQQYQLTPAISGSPWRCPARLSAAK